MARMVYKAAAAIGAALWIGGCASSGPPLGKNVSVQFRRDVLGTAATSPVPPLTGMMNGAETSVGGMLQSVDHDWIVLRQDHDRRTLWIPRSTVLLIQVQD